MPCDLISSHIGKPVVHVIAHLPIGTDMDCPDVIILFCVTCICADCH